MSHGRRRHATHVDGVQNTTLLPLRFEAPPDHFEAPAAVDPIEFARTHVIVDEPATPPRFTRADAVAVGVAAVAFAVSFFMFSAASSGFTPT